MNGIRPVMPSLTFAGKRERAAGRKRSVEDKVLAFRRDLIQLGVQEHFKGASRVIQSLNVPALTEKARRFLARREANPVWQPTPFVIGMAGGSASGKTTVKHAWMQRFESIATHHLQWKRKDHGPLVEQLETDRYYKDRSALRKKIGDEALFRTVNFDEPGAVTMDALRQDVARLKNGLAVRTRNHRFSDSRTVHGEFLKSPAPFVIVEGLFALGPEKLRKLMDLTVFVDADAKTRGERWWKRAPERGMDNDYGKAMFRRAMEMYDRHVEPAKAHADIVLNGNAPLAETQKVLHQLTKILLRAFNPFPDNR